MTFSYTPLALAIMTMGAQSAIANDQDLETVVVTGGKIERNLQQTTSGVSVLDDQMLESNNTYNLNDALVLTPNASNNGRGGFSIRGINAEGGPTSDTSTADTAGVVMDGAYFDADILEMGIGLWDINNLEVYKGPQSTSQGKNALAGTIVVKTNDPVFYHEGSVRLGFGSDNTQISSIMLNRALSDQWALRIAADRVYTDGQIENEFTGDDDEAHDEHINGRIKLLYQPSSRFSALLTVGQDKSDQGDDRACGANNSREGVFNCDEFKAFRDVDGQLTNRFNYQTLKLQAELAPQWQLTSVTSNSWRDRSERQDADNMAPSNSGYTGANNLGIRDESEEDKSLNQELRLSFDSEQLRSSFGYYYSQSEEKRGYDFLLANPLDTYLPGFYQATSAAPFPPYANGVSDTVLETQYTDRGTVREATNHALFAELDYYLTPDTTLLLGARLERETNKNSADVSAVNVNQDNMIALGARANPLFSAIKAGADAGDPASQAQWALISSYMALGGVNPDDLQADSLNKVLNVLAAAGNNTSEKENINNVFLPKLGIRHQFTDDLSAGYVLSRGYRSGGVSLNPINPQMSTVEYDPEFVTNHELSLRSQWLNKQLTANANIYYMKWKDQQVQVIGSNIYDRYITNAGSSTLKGLELDINYRANNGFSVFANAGLAKTRYDDFVTGNADYSGNRFQYAPEKTAAAGVGYDEGIGYRAFVTQTYTGDVYLDNDNRNQLPAYSLTNLRVGYAATDWKVEAYVNNLFDRRAKTYAYDYSAYTPAPSFVLYGDYVHWVPARSAGVVAQYDF
ncbi:TonB-dependent receptor [Bacterioplanes sanyensis]|nr:TonB-dependent receptor [Bacterioplanes sanyensis]